MSQKRVLAIHDISCFGRCSLTVALPIISAVGAECTVIPTAVLSTHTGGFTGYTYRDLTEDIVPIVDHWKTLDLKFDAIYTGFLGSFEQIGIVSDTFDRLRNDNTLIVVDPVMADGGKLYPIFDKEFPKEMRKLCAKADVIMPNVTEATLMLGEEYKEGPYSPEYVEGLLRRLADIGASKIVLTGISFDEKKLGAATYDKSTGEISYYFCDRIPGYYHGTGDVFGSAVVASLITGRSLPDASRIAVDYTVGSIQRTFDAKTDIRFGVNFEEGISELIEDITGDSPNEDDLVERVSALANVIWHEHYPGIISDEQIDHMLSHYHSKEALKQELADGYIFRIIQADGQDIGYCGFHNEGDRVYIGKLYILKEYRGKGYGKQMFRMIDDYTRSQGLKIEYLRTHKRNPTLDVYKRSGFRIVQEVTTQIGDGYVMDDYILEKHLE